MEISGEKMKFKINKHFIMVILAACLWGIAGIFVRTLNGSSFTQMQTVSGRTFFSALILGIIIIFKDLKLLKIRLKDIWVFASAGIFSIVLFNYSYYTTMSLTSLSVAAVLLYTAPFIVVILSIFLFKERMTLNKLIACIIAFLGCCFVSGLFDSSHRINSKTLFFGLLTGFGYALYTIFGKLLLKKGYQTLTITFYIFSFASIGCLPLSNPAATVKALISEPLSLTVLFLMAVFNTVLPYIFYTTGLSGVDPSVAPIIATIEPVVATLVGVIIYNESITVLGVFGIILVLLSVVILNRKQLLATANAKINLTLGINGIRDDGYHFIDTIMHSISLSDKITISPSKHLTVKYSDKDIDSENNMALKAARLFFEETGITGGALIKIKNRIPTSSGMGGGSADGAAVLMLLNKLYNANLSADKLEEISLSLGADVPFFIKGGAQRAEGIGEILTPLSPMKKGYFILMKAEYKLSTAEMYKKLDNTSYSMPDTQKAIDALENNDIDAFSSEFVNSFADVWKDSTTKARLLSIKADSVSLSGSGPTWFAFFKDKKAAKKAYRELKAQKYNCFIAKPQPKGIIIE